MFHHFKNISWVLVILLVFFSGQTFSQNLHDVPEKYKTFVSQALKKAGNNEKELSKAIELASYEEIESVCYLISFMPERDLQALSAEFILENVRLAQKARKEFSWCAALPDSIFLNEVLPYASLNETRENWRANFLETFGPLVKRCDNIYAAIDSINRNILKITGVEYNTQREKADQSPLESMKSGMASCTGLSILLTAAFRSVGIPSRIAGTPMWTNMRGNHNWCEVWIDGQWYFTEYYPDRLNFSWFLEDAGRADRNNPIHWIYASSFKPTGLAFPLVWDESIQYVHGHNVTDRYIDLYLADDDLKAISDADYILNVVVFQTENAVKSKDRVIARVEVLDGAEVIDFGYTPGPDDDFNRYLKFTLKRDKKYEIALTLPGGSQKKFIQQSADHRNHILKLWLE
ncbi:MAG TPA: transglutaminase-like domain-containing protein [Saprospiraceae bacterium]|nr:transglutaminase-like domain-containing protein [Saprospiraceae bacterium]